MIGLAAFPSVMIAAPANSLPLFLVGTALIGLGGGLFSVSTLTAAMARIEDLMRAYAEETA